MERPGWVNDLFASIDAMDSVKFASFIAEDGQFKFGNAPAAVGREAITAGVAGFFSALAGLKHNLLGTWREGDTMFVQGEVTYFRHDGNNVTLPFLNLFTMHGDIIQDYLVYADITPVFAPMEAEAEVSNN